MTIVDNVTARKLADECLGLILDLTRESGESPELVRQVFLLLHQQLGDMGNIEPPKPTLVVRERIKFSDEENNRLHDESTMPFGKYRSMPLGEVPDDYWRWFLRQDWCDEWPDLVDYANLIMEIDD